MACAACRQPNPATNKFCYHCGASLEAAAPAPRFAAPHTYTPKHLAERILTSRGALEGERKQVTVLFADIQGFTTLAERLDPEDLHLLMDEVFSILMEVIHRYEGTVNQFLGDGVMALLGAPVALEDHAVRAVEAALEIQETMAARAADFQGRFGAAPSLRIGLNTGRVVVGRIGDDLRMDYTAQGDTVNLAARLQQLAESGGIAMGPTTHRLVAGHFESVSLGRHPIKGKSEPVEVFRPLRSQGRGTAAVEGQVSRATLTPFIGRDEELGVLLETFDEIRAGHARLVALKGEAGIGKSRLLMEFRRRLDDSRLGWYVGDCVPYDRSTPYRAIIQLVRAILGTEAEGGTARIDQLTGPLGDQGTRVASALHYLLSLGTPDPALALLSAADRKATLTKALDVLLDRLPAVVGPTVLVIEDYQWVDSASAEYVSALAERGGAPSVMLLLTYRLDEGEHAAGGPHAEAIHLHPLPLSQAQSLVRRLGGAQLAPDLVSMAVDRAGGNPLFLEEVTRSLIEAGPASVPPTVEGLLGARIDRLPGAPKATLQTASVIGQEFSRQLVESVIEERGGLGEALRELVHLGFVVETETGADTYRFRQPLLQEVAYESLLSHRRKALHRTIGEAIERTYRHHLFEHLEKLARHFTSAEDWPRAVYYHWEAGRKAASLCANEEAVRRLERAMDMLARLPESLERSGQAIDIRLDLCPPLLQLGRLGDLLRLAQEAETFAEALGDERRLIKVYSYLSNYSYMTGQPALAISYGARCEEIGTRIGLDVRAQRTRQYLGTSYHALGNYGEAAAVLRAYVEELDRSDEVRRLGPANLAFVSSCGWLAFTHAELGEFEQGHAVAGKGVRAAAVAGHAYAQAIATTFSGLVSHAEGRIDRAVPELQAALDLCREHHLVVWRPVVTALLGHALVLGGEVAQGNELLADAVAQAERLGVQVYRPLWLTYLAEGQVAQGQVVRALRTARQAVDLAARGAEHGNHARALFVLGRGLIRLGRGGHDKAREHLTQAIEAAQTLRMRPLLARCYLELALLAREEGSPEDADRWQRTADEVRSAIGILLPAPATPDGPEAPAAASDRAL